MTLVQVINWKIFAFRAIFNQFSFQSVVKIARNYAIGLFFFCRKEILALFGDKSPDFFGLRPTKERLLRKKRVTGGFEERIQPLIQPCAWIINHDPDQLSHCFWSLETAIHKAIQWPQIRLQPGYNRSDTSLYPNPGFFCGLAEISHGFHDAKILFVIISQISGFSYRFNIYFFERNVDY